MLFNSLRPSDAIWRQWSWTTLAQVMACCLTAPSHYLNQCWLIIRGVLWHTSESSFAGIAQGIDSGYEFEKYILKHIFKSPRGQWVKMDWAYIITPYPMVCIRRWYCFMQQNLPPTAQKQSLVKFRTMGTNTVQGAFVKMRSETYMGIDPMTQYKSGLYCLLFILLILLLCGRKLTSLNAFDAENTEIRRLSPISIRAAQNINPRKPMHIFSMARNHSTSTKYWITYNGRWNKQFAWQYCAFLTLTFSISSMYCCFFLRGANYPCYMHGALSD